MQPLSILILRFLYYFVFLDPAFLYGRAGGRRRHQPRNLGLWEFKKSKLPKQKSVMPGMMAESSVVGNKNHLPRVGATFDHFFNGQKNPEFVNVCLNSLGGLVSSPCCYPPLVGLWVYNLCCQNRPGKLWRYPAHWNYMHAHKSNGRLLNPLCSGP